MLTPRIAQIALRFGADDLDGTVVEEKIYHDAGATTAQFTPRAELERLIREAGRVPVERDTLYRPVDRSKMPPPPQPRPDSPLPIIARTSVTPCRQASSRFSSSAFSRLRLQRSLCAVLANQLPNQQRIKRRIGQPLKQRRNAKLPVIW